MVGIDFGKLAGLEGLTFFSNLFHIQGNGGPGRNLVGNLNTISNIEALPTTRLSELWLQQSFLGGMASLRAGQLVVDTESLYSQYFSFFVTSDWPTNPAVNMHQTAKDSTTGSNAKIGSLAVQRWQTR